MSSTERMILGNNCIYSGNPKETGLNRNVLIVGGTGSGKTVSCDQGKDPPDRR